MERTTGKQDVQQLICQENISGWPKISLRAFGTVLRENPKKLFDQPNTIARGLPGGSVVKNLSANAGDAGLSPRLGRSSGKGNGNPLQYSYLGNPMDRGTWWATV